MGVGVVQTRALAAPDDEQPADLRAMVAAFDGPACLVAADGEVLAANPRAEPLLHALAHEPLRNRRRGPGLSLPALLAQVTLTGRSADTCLSLANPDDPGGGSVSLDITALPCGGVEPHILLLGRDTTLDRNFVRALAASRELFRDLVSCSSDFAWETDENGMFLYVSGNGALGFSPDALNGRHAPSLIDAGRMPRSAPGRAASPFVTDVAVTDSQLWLTSAAGAPLCFVVSAVPIYDTQGRRRRGARGVCRDVTALRRQEDELARAQSREQLGRAIVDATLRETNFTDMLAAAARATGLATLSQRAWVLLHRPGQGYDVGAAFGMLPHGTRHFLPPEVALPMLGAPAVASFSDGEWAYLGAPTSMRGEPNGAICIARPVSGKPFDEETEALLQLVAKHAAIAIAQAGQLKTLTDLTRADEVTGLGNRRALGEAYETWRTASPLKDVGAALLYVDLDDFKLINDRAGHGAGDSLLQTFARLLQRDSRRRDLVARVGGDEFVIWMEGMKEDALHERAERLVRAAADVPLPHPLSSARLSVSVGAVHLRQKGAPALDAVLAEADSALYGAKQAGKGRAVIARFATSVAGGFDG